jgi:murein DD-endopeptidase MepM/ murein hydrolase activator NlpD
LVKAIFVLVLLWSATWTVQALPRDSRVPGGVALIDVGEGQATAPDVSFDGRRVWVVARADRWVAVVGLPLSLEPGPQHVVLNSASNAKVPFYVEAKAYPVQHLKLPPAMVEPPAELTARLAAEAAHLGKVRETWSDGVPNGRLDLPGKGRLSSRFGVARVLNGVPRSRHAGLDIALPVGAPVRAPADGVVIDTGDYYYCGKSIIVDHGSGLLTLYCHLSRIDVHVGQRLSRGERIGAVGATGRATGPHLHWTVYLNRTSVDPELFIPTSAGAGQSKADRHRSR